MRKARLRSNRKLKRLLKPKKTNIASIASKILLTIAFFSFLIAFNIIILRIFPVPKQATLAAENTKSNIQPVEIIIKDLKIDIGVYPASYKNGTFETTTKGASYLTSTPLPGQKGNSVIYAHNWSNLFGNLYNIHNGATITIVFNNKMQKNFTVISTATVLASQVEILNNTDDTRLTLFTCADFMDSDRFVVVAK